MILKFTEDKSCKEIEVTIKCAQIDDNVRQLAESIKRLDVSFKCKDENGYIQLSLNEYIILNLWTKKPLYM